MLPSLDLPEASVPRSNAERSDSAAVGAGFESAHQFTLLVTPHLPRLVRVATEILRSEDLAWDAVQETLIRVWLRGWLPPSPERALVHLVVRSSLHELRCLRRRHVHESSVDGRHRPCCEDDPLAQLESADNARAVRAAMAKVSDDYRAALEMFTFDGTSYERIAATLDLPVGTVRSRISRGRDQLRERLLASAS